MTPFVAELAERIESDLGSFVGPFLPSVPDLALRYGVSAPTLSKALHVLADKGLVTMAPRKRARIGTAPPKATRRVAPSDRLYEALSREIIEGTLSAGTQLPKVAFTAARYRVSSHTVCKAYRLLVEMKLAHREGRSTIVGAVPPNAVAARSRARPCIVVLTAYPFARWLDICTSVRTGQFGEVFVQEVQKWGLTVYHIHSRTVARLKSRETRALPIGFDAVGRFLETIKEGWVGTLVADGRKEMPDIDKWVKFLRRGDRPVVWFDRNDEGWRGFTPDRRTFRCHYSETLAAKALVEHLHGFGHRVVAYIESPDTVYWAKARGDLVAACGAELDPPLVVKRHSFAGIELWKEPTSPWLLESMAYLHRQGPGQVRSVLTWAAQHRDDLLKQFPLKTKAAPTPYDGVVGFTREAYSEKGCDDKDLVERLGCIWSALSLLPCFNGADVTAIIAPNDQFMWHVHREWIDDVGLTYPRDVSLVSFDNHYRYYQEPLSSTDFGFGHLGYQAFHAIFGDVPVNADRQGSIPAHPTVIDHGSVEAPPLVPISW